MPTITFDVFSAVDSSPIATKISPEQLEKIQDFADKRRVLLRTRMYVNGKPAAKPAPVSVVVGSGWAL